MSTETSTSASLADDRSVAILSYLTLIGFIVAVVLHSGAKKTALGAYHLRQALGLMITGIVVSCVGVVVLAVPILGFFAYLAMWLGLLAMWVVGLVAAVSGHQRPLPVLGVQYEKWFAGAFN